VKGRIGVPLNGRQNAAPFCSVLRRMADKLPEEKREPQAPKHDGRRDKSTATDEQIREIRRLCDAGLKPRHIAEIVGLPAEYCGKVGRGETHRFVI
jgi:hypothetical protein